MTRLLPAVLKEARHIMLDCLLMIGCILMMSCGGDDSLQPQSGGKMQDVLIVGENKTAVLRTTDMLQHVMMRQLPQQEHLFQVSAVHGSLTEATRYARCILMVEVDASTYTRPSIRYERDVYAQPQYIIHLRAASANQVAGRALQQQLTRLLDRMQMKMELRYLARHHDANALRHSQRMMGADIWIPTDLTYEKTARQFLWFSNDDAKRMRNICVYSWKGTSLDTKDWINKRDSVMKCNMPGEERNMYMQTDRESVTMTPTETDKKMLHKQQALTVRGLWQMRNDAMGGPFVALSRIDTVHGRIITAEAFVYAPGEQKCNLIRSLEACLHSMKLQ